MVRLTDAGCEPQCLPQATEEDQGALIPKVQSLGCQGACCFLDGAQANPYGAAVDVHLADTKAWLRATCSVRKGDTHEPFNRDGSGDFGHRSDRPEDRGRCV